MLIYLDHNIIGDILLECDQKSLKDLGINKVGDRIRIHQSLKALRAKETPQYPVQKFSTALQALDSRSVSPFTHTTISNPVTSHMSHAHHAPHSSSRHANAHNQQHQNQSQHHSQHHLHNSSSIQLNASQSNSHGSRSHGSRDNSPQEPYFASANSARYPIPPKPKLPVPAPKYSLSAPVSASDTRPQTVTQSSGDNVNNILSMDVVKQSTVRFIYGQGHSKTVYISGCFNGDSIKRKALKKIGVKDLPENWAVHIADNELGTTTRKVTDLELVTICHSQDRKERNRLMLCLIGANPTIKQLSKSQQILRESISPPGLSPSSNRPPISQSSNNTDNDSINDSSKSNDDYNNSGTLTPSSVQKSRMLVSNNLADDSNNLADGTMMSNESSKKRLRKFYGQRPPSELISNNLKEYFPEAGHAALKETIRNSIMYKRMSRMSRVSQRSSIASAWGYQEDPENVPPLPSVDDFIPPGALPAITSTARLSNASYASYNSYNNIPEHSPPNSSRMTSRDSPTLRPTYSNTSEKSILPPTPQSAPVPPLQSTQSTNYPASINKRSSSLSLLSHKLSEADDPATDTIQAPAQNDLEEEFMDAFNRERSGPSRWIKGTVIGSGSFGTVYLGMNSITGELMAVKQVELPTGNKDTEQKKLTMIDALQREMNFLRDLQHENIVQYLGSNSEGNYLNIFLEYVPGGSVATMLSNYGAFEESLIRNFVRQILHGLHYLHQRSIIHRDIKGANVLVDNKGGIKISDFGISKKLEARLLTAENNRVSLQGSVYWMAPEVVKQTSYTLKADIWSLGCLIIEMFTGTHPFPEFSQMQAIFKIGTFVAPAIPSDCSVDAQNFLKQTFEIDFNKRPTAEELLKQPFLKPLL